jgi:16S rRNA (adenine1518-N6/adenine1519-N6)-dimethyltransferase
VAAKRHLGQHFLSDPRILGRIADALAASPGDPVLEIGPGKGGLTRALLGRGARLVAIERDADLVAGLLAEFPGLRVVAGDALRLDWRSLLGVGPDEPWYVIGNIPYRITSPLLAKALEPPRPRRVVFLVQRELADRLGAAPGGRDYGALTVGVQAVADVTRLFHLPAGAFRPPPRVESAVVRLDPRTTPLVPDSEAGEFRRLVTGLFGARRKQLARALRTAAGVDVDQAAELIAGAGLDPSRRPETVSPSGFAALHRRLVDARRGGGLAL